MSILFSCGECEKEVANILKLGAIELYIRFPRFSDKGRKEETYTRFDFETDGLCKECIEKITGNSQERLENIKKNQIIKIINGLFELKSKIGI